MTLPDLRFISLTRWLTHYFSTDILPALISGDASFRRYFRVVTLNGSFIAVDSPPEKIPLEPFMALAKAYSAIGLKVPRIIAADVSQGFMLLSDLGDNALLSVLTNHNVRQYYRQALDLLPQVTRVQSIERARNTHFLPRFDEAFLYKELALFKQWFLGEHLQLSLTADEQALISQSFNTLVENALSQPQVGMHRDFHSRNLMVHAEQLWIIDFQDAVIGPVTYDAVSLLRDCYIKWPKAVVAELMHYHYEQLLQQGLLCEQVCFTQYQSWFDLMGLQRHIKAVGIFSRLHYRDNKSAYLADIPLTLHYIIEVASCYPQLLPFSSWIQRRVMPLLTQSDMLEVSS